MKQCIEAVARDAHRVTCAAKLDYRQGGRNRLVTKVDSVQQQLGREVKR